MLVKSFVTYRNEILGNIKPYGDITFIYQSYPDDVVITVCDIIFLKQLITLCSGHVFSIHYISLSFFIPDYFTEKCSFAGGK